MGILIFFIFFATIVFDLIPQMFGYKGLTNWFCETYETEADILIYLIYIPFIVFLYWATYYVTNR